ncbi:MAG: rhomboid family intramembrane serine protease [Gammaproteobacteria bacterium]
MLIPVDKRPDWHNPPVITLLLIVVNIFCFTLLATDNTNKVAAFDYYLRSALPAIEIPAYIQHLQETGQTSLARQMQAAYSNNPQETRPHALQRMLLDGAFQRRLQRGEIITSAHEDFSTWQAKHQTFMQKLNLVASYRFSLKAYDFDAAALLSHFFLHTDLSHLLWNIFFLLIFGFIVEARIGHLYFIAAYMLAGLASSMTFVLAAPNSGAWNLGASGAIAGLVGMYAVLYGRRKIQFFYTLIFYFDYIKAPAYFILPVWLGYEIYSQFAVVDNVNNLAHIGGLLFGALAAWSIKKYLPHILQDQNDDTDTASLENARKFSRAMALLADLHLPQAKVILDELNQQQDNIDWLYARYTIAKYEGKQPRQVEYINRILSLEKIGENAQRIIASIFADLQRNPELCKDLQPSSIRRLGLLFVQWNEDESLNELLTLGHHKMDPGYQYDTIAMIINSLMSRGKDALAKQFRQHLPSIVPPEA